MRSSSQKEIVDVFDALDAEISTVPCSSFDALTTPERLAMLQRCERIRRRLPAVEHPLNRSREQVLADREAERVRKAEWRKRHAMPSPVLLVAYTGLVGSGLGLRTPAGIRQESRWASGWDIAASEAGAP